MADQTTGNPCHAGTPSAAFSSFYLDSGSSVVASDNGPICKTCPAGKRSNVAALDEGVAACKFCEFDDYVTFANGLVGP